MMAGGWVLVVAVLKDSGVKDIESCDLKLGKPRPRDYPAPVKEGNLKPGLPQVGEEHCTHKKLMPNKPDNEGWRGYALSTDFIPGEKYDTFRQQVEDECPEIRAWNPPRWDPKSTWTKTLSTTFHWPPFNRTWTREYQMFDFDATFVWQMKISEKEAVDGEPGKCVLKAAQRAGSFSDLHECVNQDDKRNLNLGCPPWVCK